MLSSVVDPKLTPTCFDVAGVVTGVATFFAFPLDILPKVCYIFLEIIFLYGRLGIGPSSPSKKMSYGRLIQVCLPRRFSLLYFFTYLYDFC